MSDQTPPIHFFWDSDPPAYVLENIQTWRDVYPTADVRIYSDSQARLEIQNSGFKYGVLTQHNILDMYDRSRVPAMKSDVFRALIVYVHGGIYVDGGISAVAPIDPFMTQQHDLVLYHRRNGIIANGLYMARAKSPFLAEVLERMHLNFQLRKPNNVHAITGPVIWTQLYRQRENSDALRIKVLEHSEIAKSKVRFIHDYPHKKEGRHWSDVQEHTSIFRTYEGPNKRVTLHLGVHKTASTFVQLALKSAAKALQDQYDVTALSVHSPDAEAYNQFRLPFVHLRNEILLGKNQGLRQALESPCFILAREALDRLIAESPGSHVIISDENLLGIPIGQSISGDRYFERTFYPKADMIACCLREMLSEHAVDAVIYQREKYSLIESLYSNALANLSFEGSIDDFFNAIDHESINFDRLITLLSDSLGFEVTHACFERIRLGTGLFAEDFSMATGVRIPDQFWPSRPSNGRLCDTQVVMAREFSKGSPKGGEKLDLMRQLRTYRTTASDSYQLTRLDRHQD